MREKFVSSQPHFRIGDDDIKQTSGRKEEMMYFGTEFREPMALQQVWYSALWPPPLASFTWSLHFIPQIKGIHKDSTRKHEMSKSKTYSFHGSPGELREQNNPDPFSESSSPTPLGRESMQLTQGIARQVVQIST